MRTSLMCIALIASSALPSIAEEVRVSTPGYWKIPNRVGAEQTSLLAIQEDEATYRICRNRVDVGTTGTFPLDLIVDNNIIGNDLVHENSLDDGSCSIVRGKEVSFRYKGNPIELSQNMSLDGSFVELNDDLRGYREYTQISTWRYRGTRETDIIHELTLVELNSSHSFQFCHRLEDVEPKDGFIRFNLVVDDEVLSINGSDYIVDHTNCVSFSGSKVQLIPDTWSPNLSYYRGEGALYLQNLEFTALE